MNVLVTGGAGFIGSHVVRLLGEKRQEDAIRAVVHLLHRGITPLLFVAGDGDRKYREYLRNLVVRNDADNYIEFLGYVEDPLPLMRCADVVLMCSSSEAFGRVTVEGMKLGKPVIGASSCGTRELVRDGFNGLLYAPGNPKELAEKIRYFCEHPYVAGMMGRNGQEWATKHFTQDRYGEEVLAVLRQLVRRHELTPRIGVSTSNR